MTPRPQDSVPPGFVVLANRSAGSVERDALGQVVTELAEHAPTVLAPTAEPGDIDRALLGLDGRRPVVAGGDGTLHLVVNRLRALGLAEVPLALVPLGTGNDLARGAGLPLEAGPAARLAATGRPRPMPLAIHAGSGEAVVNNVHTGIGERAARRAAGLKPRLGALAYPAGAVVAGVRPAATPVTIRIDGTPAYRGTAVAVVVALGPSAGGGHRIVPDADPPDATLDVVVVEAGSVRSRLGLALWVAAGRDPSARPDVQRWTGRAVEVAHTGRDRAHWDLDGESRTWPSPASLVIEPGAWHLVH